MWFWLILGLPDCQMTENKKTKLICLFYLLSSATAQAGAWVLPMDETKLSLNHSTHEQHIVFPAIAGSFPLRDENTSLLMEHGLRDAYSVTAKLDYGTYSIAGQKSITQSAQIGLLVDAPKLATGLLPPFSYRVLKKLLPEDGIYRDRRASLGFGPLWRETDKWRSGTHVTLAMADKIGFRRFHVTQEIEFSDIRLGKIKQRHGQYRFSLGFGNWQAGSQTNQFEDSTSGYVSLSHLYQLTWYTPDRDIEIILSRGHRRISQISAGAMFHRGRLITLEFQRRF